VTGRLTRADLYIGMAVLVLGCTAGMLYLPVFRAGGGEAMFYQEEYGPAVMAACGRGLVNVAPQSSSSLDAFLHKRSDQFDCRSLPESISVIGFDPLQGVTRYLLVAAAAVWRVAGVSWRALDSLSALMFGVALAGAYLALRFVAGPILSAVGTVLWASSPLHLGNLPHLRDYSKAPFFVLTVVAMGLTVRERRGWRLIALGAGFGFVQGLGLGMRTDVVLNFVPFLIALFAFGHDGPSWNIRGKLAAGAAALAVFVVLSWPILKVYSQAEGLWHVSLLGLTTPFDRALNIHGAPYDFGYLYDDSYMSTVVEGYWRRAHGAPPDGLHVGSLYDRACREYYQLLASTFPGDFLSRMAGSALHVLNLPFSIAYGAAPLGITSPVLVEPLNWRTRGIMTLAGLGPLAAGCLLLFIGMRGLWNALVAFVLLMFWTTYPFLQFHWRHVFHLEILAFAVCISAGVLAWRTICDAARDRSWHATIVRASKAGLLVAGLLASVVATIAVARTVQTSRVRALFRQYDDAPARAATARVEQARPGFSRIVPSVVQTDGFSRRFEQAMLVLDFHPKRCSQPAVDVNIRYADHGPSAAPEFNFSHEMTVPVGRTGSAPTRVFVPVYSVPIGSDSVYAFTDLEVPDAAAGCIGVSRARQVEQSPLLLDVTLQPGWAEQPLFERVYLGSIVPERLWLKMARWWPRIAELG